MTAQEYFELEDPTGGFFWELHFGELVRKEFPNTSVYMLKLRIRDLLEGQLGQGTWLIGNDMPYGLVADIDVRGADIGVCQRESWDRESGDVYIGSPAIVIQIGIEEDVSDHIRHGASAVWLVKPERQEVIVITASARQVYVPGQAIPLPGTVTLAVNDIFSL
jgi:hypothetical protein